MMPSGNTDRIKKYGRIAAASESQIREYFNVLASDGRVAGHRQHVKTAVKKYFDYLMDINAIKAKPSLEFPIRKSAADTGKEKPRLSEEDVELFRQASTGRDRFLLECMICLGARVHEIKLLRASDFDITNNIVSLRSTKTEGKSMYGGARSVPITPMLMESFEEFVAEPTSDERLFSITKNRMGGIVKAIAVSLGLDWVSPHDFRHYCITKFSSQTGSDGYTPIFREGEVSKMFGVSPEVIAKTYYHPDIKDTVGKAMASGLTI
jgi:integrase